MINNIVACMISRIKLLPTSAVVLNYLESVIIKTNNFIHEQYEQTTWEDQVNKMIAAL